jgi:NADPH:quinone reductase-like Zn-dependent oxidoreductase
MRAAVCERYGPPEVVKVKELPKPVPGDNEVLIRSHASTVDIADVRIRAMRVPRGFGLPARLSMGLFKPKQPIFGMVLAGEIEAVGKDVTRFKVGDKVFGTSGFDFGCHAEYRALPESGALAPMPEGLSYGEAAALCFGAITAITFFRCGKLLKGERLLVNGASGAVGTAAVQIAKHHIGAEVIGVCSGGNAEFVRSLGADEVIDYTKQDFTKGGETYDAIMDMVGNAPFSRVKHLLGADGRVFMVIGNLWQMIQAGSNKRIINGEEDGGAKTLTADVIRSIAEMAEKGVLKPVIDRTYPLEEIAAAHAHVDGGHKRGNVVLTLS